MGGSFGGAGHFRGAAFGAADCFMGGGGGFRGVEADCFRGCDGGGFCGGCKFKLYTMDVLLKSEVAGRWSEASKMVETR